MSIETVDIKDCRRRCFCSTLNRLCVIDDVVQRFLFRQLLCFLGGVVTLLTEAEGGRLRAPPLETGNGLCWEKRTS